MEYQVSLSSFHGPLDLLLYLVKRNEVDVRDIPVAKVAAQFLEHLHIIQVIDVEWAGDFLVLAATLLEIKSRLLLPRAPEEPHEAEADPRRELVKQLVEYRKTKEAAGELERLAEERQFLIARTAPEEEENTGSPRLRRVELWDLVSAFGRLIRETQAFQPTQLIVDETPQSTYQNMVLDYLSTDACRPFRALFVPPYHRLRLIGLFLALLELIKLGEVQLEQSEPFGEIWLTRLVQTPKP